MNTNEIPQREIDQLVADIDLIKNAEALPSGKREELVEDLRSAVNVLTYPNFPSKMDTLFKLKQKVKDVLSGNGQGRLFPERQAA